MVGARSRRAARIADVFDVTSLRGGEDVMNRSAMTRRVSGEPEWFWVALPVTWCPGMDDLVAESNYHVAEARLERVSSFGEDGVDWREDAWVGPPLRTLMVRVDDAAAVREALTIVDALLDYPVLDDADLSDREVDAKLHAWGDWVRGAVIDVMRDKHDIPEGLFVDGWDGYGPVDVDGLAVDAEAWPNGVYDEWDVDDLARELAGTVREHVTGSADSAAVDCWCCGAPVVGPVWALCDGCDGHDRSGEYCDADGSWHCTGVGGHECDGTACP